MGNNVKISLTDALVKLCDNTDPSARNWDYLDDVYRIERFSRAGDDCEGVFVRIRPGELPKVASRQEDGVRELPMPQGYSPADSLVFRYYHEKEAIVFERHRTVAGYRKFAEYLRNKTNMLGFYLNIAVNEENDKKLRRMKKLHSLHLKTSGRVQNLFGYEPVQNQPMGLTLFSDMNRIFGGYVIDLNIRQVAKKKSMPMNIEEAKDTVLTMFANQFPLDVAVMKGLTDDLEEITVDFINNRVVNKQVIKYSGNYPQPDEILKGLDDAYKIEKDNLPSRRRNQ